MSELRSDSVSRQAERGIRCGLLAVLVVGLRRRNPGATVNAALAFAVTYLPDAFERQYDIEFQPWQRTYAESATLTHAVGMLGPYDDTWWWDHLTHTHSATLLSAIVYAAARRRGVDPRPRVLGAVVGAGLVWEMGEYVSHAVADRLGVEPVLVMYGGQDTLIDMCFNLLGALLVLAFGDRLLRNFTERPADRRGYSEATD